MFQTDKIQKYRMSRYRLKVIANGTGNHLGHCWIYAQGPGASDVVGFVKSIEISLLINVKPAWVYLT